MNSKRNKTLGFLGEELASKYIASKGLKIIERNFTKRYGEIDIVALDGNTLVFVEVKTRLGNKFGTPEEAVTPQKLRSLTRSAHYYKLLHPRLPCAMRIDVVGILLSAIESVEKITLYKNVTG